MAPLASPLGDRAANAAVVNCILLSVQLLHCPMTVALIALLVLRSKMVMGLSQMDSSREAKNASGRLA